MNLLRKLFGNKNDRELRRMRKEVSKVNSHAEAFASLDDGQLRDTTAALKARLASGETLNALLPEAFAAVREASTRVLGLRHFDVQLIGALVLHEGKIAEMRTGEGKTLVATAAVYLNALTGDGVHVVTVNDYLARRDASWMAPLYAALGLSVGVIQSYRGAGSANSFLFDPAIGEMEPCGRRDAYAADITYGTNNEFGFDYLRDNMALRLEEKSQRKLAFAVVDEVDSILIDEARTPLIISGAAKDSSALYKRMNAQVQLLTAVELDDEGAPLNEGHFVIDEKMRQIELTEEGHEKIESILISDGLLGEDESLYQAANLSLLHHVLSALKAHHLFHRDVEYIVQNGEAILIDEHTGRTMPGRRLSEGLHQAIEAKEGLTIQQESQTMASTTFQNFFRLYGKLAGMTGTADTEAYEFHQIYGLQVVVIPTNVPVARIDKNDLIYLTEDEKYQAVIEEIVELTGKGAPVLVGTASVDSSERLSKALDAAKVKHNVLNAKQHEREAGIIIEAGRPGAVTIATNMAGRGTDIVLGGNVEAEIKALDNPSDELLAQLRAEWQQRQQQVLDAGGLHIIGTERHESRRIDNQLRGRAGRQGDPGYSRFYLSLEDPLMRLFASDRIKNMMRAMGMEQGEAIEHRMVTNAIVKAQRKVEGRNFDIRKHLLEYDDVANDQRQVIYQQRNDLLEDGDISEIISSVRSDVIDRCISTYVPPMSLEEQWDVEGLERSLELEFALKAPVSSWLEEDQRFDEEALRERLKQQSEVEYQQRYAAYGEQIKEIERQVMLQVLDSLWKDHLANMDQLRQGIGLRAYAQKNPKQEYKRESFELFEQLLDNIKYDTIKFLSNIKIAGEEDLAKMEAQRRQETEGADYQHAESSALEEAAPTPAVSTPQTRQGPKVGRNDPCPCGSGKKYKQCHGRI
ncbi:preprotein translocase subunit SecA [Porticoccaceae bacterium]|nr:preprotein translocase subunit SecA [Porticoccaceae bacterium]